MFCYVFPDYSCRATTHILGMGRGARVHGCLPPPRDLSFGWLPLVAVPADIVSTLAGGHSELMRHLWHVLFTASGNLRDGVDVGGFFFKGEPCAVLADEAALKAVFAVKGASGTLCCARCQNREKASQFHSWIFHHPHH